MTTDAVKMPGHQALKSSVLKSASHLASKSILDITFLSGATYRYHDVDDTVALELFTAGSPGRYYTQFIKGAYRSEKL